MYVLILTLFLSNNTLSQGVIHNQMFGAEECQAYAAEMNYQVSQKAAEDRVPGVKAEVWTCGKVLEVPGKGA